jgi:hypothetical protein
VSVEPRSESSTQLTRVGAIRGGFDYQDIIALEMLVDFLEHPKRYEWIQVEADDAGYLDDVVALRADGILEAVQVKFTTDPEGPGGEWTWDDLLNQKISRRGAPLQSLLQKWASSLDGLLQSHPKVKVRVVSNRQAVGDLRDVLLPDWRVDLERVQDIQLLHRIEEQVGGHEGAVRFFGVCCFDLNQPGLSDKEEAVKRRFFRLGASPSGWLSLKDELRSWVLQRDQPPPDGRITLGTIRRAALFGKLESMPQRFEIPGDYVLPSESMHRQLLTQLEGPQRKCIVVTASPGMGKSTYLSFLHDHLVGAGTPVVRHHYFLSLSDRTPRRFDHEKVAVSLMADLKRDYEDALGELASRSPSANDLGAWVEACGRHFYGKGKSMVIILDGLDHVWRSKGSFEELGLLLEYLLPAPEGVVLVVGTQPLDEDLFPSILLQSAPVSEWFRLTPLDHAGTRAWVKHHAKEFDLPSHADVKEHVVEDLARAFGEASGGHPLVLKYCLKQIAERGMAPTANVIRALPKCPHSDVVEYYEGLWRVIPPQAREILHLTAVVDFQWPRYGILQCLKRNGARPPDILAALKQVQHLLTYDELGLRPFHSSLRVFVEGTAEHAEQAQLLRPLVLNWLQTDAPEFWRWSWEWHLRADAGETTPLIDGPNRTWAIEALAKRYPSREASSSLARSAWLALETGRIDRFAEVGLIRDYYHEALEGRREVMSKLLDTQLRLAEDQYLESRLTARLHELTGPEVAILAEHAAGSGNDRTVADCFEEIRERLAGRRADPEGTYVGTTRVLVEALMRVAAIAVDAAPEKVGKFIAQIADEKERLTATREYARSLRSNRRCSRLLGVLSAMDTFSVDTEHVVLRECALMAATEGAELPAALKSSGRIADPFCMLTTRLRTGSMPTVDGARMPPSSLLNLELTMQFHHAEAITDRFIWAFFAFLANHLAGKDELNQVWIANSRAGSYPAAILSLLDRTASALSISMTSGQPVECGWFHQQFDSLARPVWDEDARYFRYASCASEALNTIMIDALEMLRLRGAAVAITERGLRAVLDSVYADPWDLVEKLAELSPTSLSAESAGWLVRELEPRLNSGLEQFTVRASRYATLACLAVRFGANGLGRELIRSSVANALSYGDHKDTLLHEGLEVAEAVATEFPCESRGWLLQMAPAIAVIDKLTDGRETNYLPGTLAEALVKVSPDLLPQYYRWLCETEDYYHALDAFRAFLRTADMNDSTVAALVSTAMDTKSLGVIERRAAEGDVGALRVMHTTCSFLGSGTPAWVRSAREQESRMPDLSEEEGPQPDVGQYSPERFPEFVEVLRASRVYTRFEDRIGSWFTFWNNAGQGEVALRAIEAAEAKGTHLVNYDTVFEAVLRQKGKAEAYRYLVRAHSRRAGWARWAYDESEAVLRWNRVLALYPDKWREFILDTMRADGEEPWARVGASGTLGRLVKYCLSLKQNEQGRALAIQVVASVLEYVSAVPLPRPAWMPNR